MKRTKLAPVSKKQAAVNRNISKIFHEILIDSNGECTGCRGIHNLTPSHIIRRSKRKDLEAVKENIKPHCISCHNKWDSGNIFIMSELLDFESNMRYIFEVDRFYYNRLKEQLTEATL